MPTVFPQAFSEQLSASFGAETAARVLTALGTETPSVSIRINPFRRPDPLGAAGADAADTGEAGVPNAAVANGAADTGAADADAADTGEAGVPNAAVANGAADTGEAGADAVPWSPYGRMLRERPNFTLDPLFHAGCYYVQDSSAMFVGELLRRVLDGKVRTNGEEVLPPMEPGLRMLDLCAAPGGKTTDAAASLRERYGDGFTLLANEVMRPRYAVLRSNVRTWGDPRVGTVSRDPAVFGKEVSVFDIVLTDVPCSGEGMFRKDPRALAEWSPETVEFCAARQRRILSDVWPALRPGGILIYATCTFNRAENDDNVAWIAAELGAEVLDAGDGGPGILRTPAGGYALLPGLVPGEGQYAAVLRKSGSSHPTGDPFRIFRAEMPAETADGASNATPAGIPAGAAIRNRCPAFGSAAGNRRPAFGSAIGDRRPAFGSAIGDRHSDSDGPAVPFPVDRQTALQYLHGDALRLPGAPVGPLTLTYRGVPLGPAKNIGPRVNNLYPKDRRIRMDIPKYDETQ